MVPALSKALGHLKGNFIATSGGWVGGVLESSSVSECGFQDVLGINLKITEKDVKGFFKNKALKYSICLVKKKYWLKVGLCKAVLLFGGIKLKVELGAFTHFLAVISNQHRLWNL